MTWAMTRLPALMPSVVVATRSGGSSSLRFAAVQGAAREGIASIKDADEHARQVRPLPRRRGVREGAASFEARWSLAQPFAWRLSRARSHDPVHPLELVIAASRNVWNRRQGMLRSPISSATTVDRPVSPPPRIP